MTPVHMLALIHQGLRQLGHPEIVCVSFDNDNDSGEVIVTTRDGRDFIIRSGDIQEEATEDEQ